MNSDYNIPTYQHADAMELVRKAARQLAKPGERVIYRDAFRWKDDATGDVLPNHYECQGLSYMAQEHGWTLVHNFHHVAVIGSTPSGRGGENG
jgi:hypothetical protein